ncbi:ABC transporter permease [Rhizobium sp. 1AS11]|uniref:ABC transporter permease n=1 Tax=Rhizobium acaciae TaxID=2989736 RepID=UPI002221C8F5|nr:ABC transporter permease [Rhizobium acaciae]MCW1411288.1 ABC transporter permease [Rhizobium acaciae]MCW1743300.1 ABC transporter permease [Rhizobium acaciae]
MTAASPTSPAKRLRRQMTIFLLLLPVLAITVIFFVVPMAAILVSNLQEDASGAIHYTLGNYVSVVTDDFYWEIMLRTIRLSALATIVALLLAYPAALYVYFSRSIWRRLMLLIVVSPLFISVIVRTYGWMVVFSPNGLIDAMLPAKYALRLLNTQTAIILGLVHIYLPFMVLSLNASLLKLDQKLLSAAASLGASSWRSFRDVILPLSLPGVQSGCVIVFASAMTAFATPMLLGGSANKTMAYMIYQQNILLANWNMGGAVAFVLLAMTLAFVFFMGRLLERRDLKEALR